MTDPFKAYTLSPGAVATLTEPTPELQRNYRTRGMMDGIGHADENGRWKYSLRDLVAIWISDRLSLRGQSMDRRDAIRFGAALSGAVIAGFLQSRRGSVITVPRFEVVLSDGFDEGARVHGQTVKRVMSLQELEAEEFDGATVIDIHRLAKTIPAEIRSLLVVASENEYDDLGLPGLVEGLDD